MGLRSLSGDRRLGAGGSGLRRMYQPGGGVEPDVTAPPVPTGVTAAAGASQVTVSWGAVTADDLAGYRVYYATSGSGPWTEFGTLAAGTSRAVTGLTNGTDYWFVVTSEDTTGNESAQSSTATARPVPTNLVPSAVAAANNGTTGWLNTGGNAAIGVESSPLTAFDGSNYYTSTATAASSGNVDSPPFAVSGSTVYSVGVRHRWKTGATPRNIRLDVRWFSDEAGTVATGSTSTGTSVATSTGSWSLLTRNNLAASPAGAVSARLRVVLVTPAVSDSVAFDGLLMQAGASLVT